MTTTTCSLLHDAWAAMERIFAATLPAKSEAPQQLHEAMHYALLAGGKRVRPALVMGACRAVGGDDADGAPAMAAVEILHTYTLVHDDLPAMDDDDLRRGRATVHKVWDEATAILVGDALQTLAFTSLSALPAAAARDCLRVLGEASGSRGVVGGQQDDLAAEGGRGQASDDPATLLQRIHSRKTAGLIRASCHLGAICGGGSEQQQASLSAFGEHVGLAFQIIDDILDAQADEETLGKTPGKDASTGKLTWVSVHGLEAARQAAAKHTAAAHTNLDSFGSNADGLRELAGMLLARSY